MFGNCLHTNAMLANQSDFALDRCRRVFPTIETMHDRQKKIGVSWRFSFCQDIHVVVRHEVPVEAILNVLPNEYFRSHKI